MSDRVFIAGLVVQAVIGVDERERRTPQDVQITVWMTTDIRPAADSDDPRFIVDYAAVAAAIGKYANTSRHRLLETLATEIARICVMQHGVDRVIVSVGKPGAVPAAQSAGVEIERGREDFAP